MATNKTTNLDDYQNTFAKQLQEVLRNVKKSIKFYALLKGKPSLFARLRTLDKKPNTALIEQAYAFAMEKHSKQKRASGEPYFVHLIGTALTLSEYGADEETIAAGFLHDVLEDTHTSKQELIDTFGSNIANLVEGVTKLDELSEKSRKTKQIKYLQRVLIASTKDIRVLIIKLADKLHNVRTLRFLSPEKKLSIASLVLDVYGPLAHKIGMHNIEYELEDLCFPLVYPEQFRDVKPKIEEGRLKKAREIDEMFSILKSKAKALKSNYVFDKKVKGYYSIYRKIVRLHKSLDETYDYAILLVLTDSVAECYEALGLVHTTFHPLPQKLKDYIAIPQMTYNAIHTTVLGPSGMPVKVHIKTKRMHELAGKGIISWLQRTNVVQEYSEKEWDSLHAPFETESNDDEFAFYDALKKDFLEPQIFVFTVNGGIVKLPWGSSAVDFGYRINPEVGNRIERVKVNGRVVPLWTVLDSGDIVEIITSNALTVKSEWIDFAKTHNAHDKIKTALNLPEKSKEIIENVLVIVRAVDRKGLLADLSKLIAESNIFIDEYYVIKEEGNNIVKDCFLVHITKKKEIDALIERCTQIKGVLNVTTS